MKIETSHISVGSITEDGRYTIALTGPNSHSLIREAGVGSLTIGPTSLDKKANLHVESNMLINWSVFDLFATPGGSLWPRSIHYTGNDIRLFDWARDRPIEILSWCPAFSNDIAVDASLSKIQQLQIELNKLGGRLHLTLPRRDISPYFRLCVRGDLARLTIHGDIPHTLELVPHTGSRRNNVPYLLPDMGAMRTVTRLELRNGPMAEPISLKDLGLFPNLESLSLWGNFTDFEALANQKQLEILALRFIPNLAALPQLSSWPHLKSFIAFNIEEATGKRLRMQLKARSTIRPWEEHASVSQLRKPEWWDTEFGRPFSAWSRRLAKVANKAYDAALTTLASAKTIAEAQKAFTDFTINFNMVKGIETTERDDLGEAVWLLSQSSDALRLGISAEMAQQWFNDARDY